MTKQECLSELQLLYEAATTAKLSKSEHDRVLIAAQNLAKCMEDKCIDESEVPEKKSEIEPKKSKK